MSPVSRPPLRQIAELAGVSEPTVSRVLNGRRGVSATTRERVVEALSRLGFTDIPPAGRTGRGTVGIVTGELTNPVFGHLVHTVAGHLAGHGIVAVAGIATTGLMPEERYIEEYLASQVDGLVLIAGRHAEHGGDLSRYRMLVDQGLPLVLVNGGRTGLPVPHILADEAVAAERAVEHLLALGHRRIGAILGSRKYVATMRFIEGYQRAMTAAGAELPDDGVVETAFTLEGGQAGARRLMANDVTALVCGNDLIAVGAVWAARSLGLDVPDDVSVVGYDGTDFTAICDPPLTTLRQPFSEMSRLVAEALMSEIDGSQRFRDTYVFAPELIARRTTGRHSAVQPSQSRHPRAPEAADDPV